MNVISSAVSCEKPRLAKRRVSSGAIPFVPVQSWPWEKPSKLVVPIIVHSSATVPGMRSRRVVPERMRRRDTVRSRQCSGASFEKRLK